MVQLIVKYKQIVQPTIFKESQYCRRTIHEWSCFVSEGFFKANNASFKGTSPCRQPQIPQISDWGIEVTFTWHSSYQGHHKTKCDNLWLPAWSFKLKNVRSTICCNVFIKLRDAAHSTVDEEPHVHVFFYIAFDL